MSNKSKISIVLGLMCFALTCGICIQIKTVQNTTGKVSSNYEENNLRAEVLKYKEKYDKKIEETEKIDKLLETEIEKATENDTELKTAKKEIKKGNMLLGLTDVTGPGVIINVKDSDVESKSVLDASQVIVHDKDILSIVNELKNAGAEAISINGQRLVFSSAIYCGGNIININGERIGSPFEIKAIGLPETLANLGRPGGYLANLEERGVDVSIEKSENVTIPKYSGVLQYDRIKTN